MAKEREQGRIGAIIKVIASQLHYPYSEPGYLRALLEREIPDLKNREKCPNCDASMYAEVYKIDAFDARLLLWMGNYVRKQRGLGVPFTEANKGMKPHKQDRSSLNATSGLRASKCSKLGLVAKADGGGWLITRRGFEFLRNEPVPYKVKVWRGRIIDRYDQMVKMSEIKNDWLQEFEERKRKGKDSDRDHASQDDNLQQWHPNAYTNLEGPEAGRIM